jgi:hypothetical protein
MSTTAAGRSTVSRIRSISVVPPAMNRAPDTAAANADASSRAFEKVNGNTAGYVLRAALAIAVTMLV